MRQQRSERRVGEDTDTFCTDNHCNAIEQCSAQP